MKTILFLLLAAACYPLSAQESQLADRRPDWAIGVAAFEGRDLSPENAYLTRSFPLLLRERLEAIPEHYFSDAEVQAYRKIIVQEERKRLVKAVSADRRARDELFFTSDSPARDAAVYEQRIADNLQAIRDLEETDLEQISFPRSKPLRFVSGADGQLVFDREVLSPFQLAKQQDLDVLLWGSFEEVQGFLYFEVSLFSAALGEPIFTYSDAAAAVDLYAQSEELIAELATALWGRDWSSLKVETVPEGASVWIDEQFQGRSPLSIPYLLPGPREMRLELPGYRPVQRSIELSPYVEQLQEITLVAQQIEPFTVESDPEGAAVYRGSEWLGTTPLSVQKPEELSRFLLRHEGYLDYPLYAYPTPGQSVTVELLPDSLDPIEIQNRRRNELYRAFGAFALSIPPPLFAWDYWNEYTAQAINYSFQGRDAEAAAAQKTADRISYVYYATLAVSSGLFVNFMVHLVRYLKAADRKA